MLKGKKYLFTKAVAASLVTITLSGCTNDDILSSVETKTPTGVQATQEPISSEQVSEKLTAPIILNYNLIKERYTKHELIEIKVQPVFDELDEISKSGKIIIEEDGPLKIEGKKEFEFPDIRNNEDKTITLIVSKPIPENGIGVIKLKYSTYDKNGNMAHYIMKSVGYYIFDTGIIFGHSPGLLRDTYLREPLDKLLEEGKITKERYEHEWNKINTKRKEMDREKAGMPPLSSSTSYIPK